MMLWNYDSIAISENQLKPPIEAIHLYFPHLFISLTSPEFHPGTHVHVI